MGDSRRFDVFADYVVSNWPERGARIADVACGKGGLQATLRRRGYRNVISIDKRRKCAHPDRPNYRYGWWEPGMAAEFDLVLGMHPDGATEAIVQSEKPYAVVPCCTDRGLDYPAWISELCRIAPAALVDQLPMSGRSLVLRHA